VSASGIPAAVTATHGPSLPRAASRLLGMRRATRIAPASRRGPSGYALRDAARWLASIASQPHQRPAPSLRAAPPACAGHAVRLVRPAGAPHSDGGKPPTRCFRMLTPLHSFHPSGTVTGWALRIRIRENSTAVFRLRTFGPGLRPNTGGCPWRASDRRNTALAHALIARRANHPASFPLPNFTLDRAATVWPHETKSVCGD
jgi:hypothetical protein